MGEKRRKEIIETKKREGKKQGGKKRERGRRRKKERFIRKEKNIVKIKANKWWQRCFSLHPFAKCVSGCFKAPRPPSFPGRSGDLTSTLTNLPFRSLAAVN